MKTKTGTGLEALCLVTLKVTGHIFSKVEPIVKDFCI